MKLGWNGGISISEDETKLYGRKMANFIDGGDIIKLSGDIGSGKTTFVNGLAEGLGYNDIVNSPTYTLINEYPSEPRIVHMDCYREKDIQRWILLGIDEYFSNRNLVLIEWPKIIEPLLPDNNVYELLFTHISESERSINIK